MTSSSTPSGPDAASAAGVSIRVNGAPHDLPPGSTLVDVLALLGIAVDRGGIAVAVGDRVVPRARWAETALANGDRIEVVTAAQGG